MRSLATIVVFAALLPLAGASAAESPDQALERARRLAEEKQYAGAIDVLATLLASDLSPSLPASDVVRARAQLDRLCFELLMVDQPQLAITGLKVLMATGPAPPMRWAMLARAYVDAGEFRLAAQTLKRGLSQHPNSAELLFVRAALAGSMSEQAVARASYASAESMLRGAAADLEKAVKEEPDQPGIHRALGKIRASLFVYCRATGQSDEALRLWELAEQAYEQAMALDQANPDLAFELAELQSAAGDHAWAAEIYRQAEQGYARLARQSQAPGLAQLARDRAEACRQRRVQAIEARARLAAEGGRFERAAALLAQVVELQGEQAATQHAALAKLRRRQEAFAAERARLEARPADGDAQVKLGDLLRDSARYDQARLAYLRARSAEPRSHTEAELEARIASVLALPATSLRLQWTIGNQAFILNLPPEAQADRIRSLLEKAHALTMAVFRHRLLGPVHLSIFANQRAFRERAGMAVRPGVRGLYAFGRIMSYAEPSRGRARWLEILTHELSHRYVDEMSYGKAPIWLSEGLAQVHLERKPADPVGAQRAAWVPWRLLEQRLAENRDDPVVLQALLRQARHMVAWLLRRFGAERMMTLLNLLRQGLPMNQAMQNAYDQSQDVLEGAWRQER